VPAAQLPSRHLLYLPCPARRHATDARSPPRIAQAVRQRSAARTLAHRNRTGSTTVSS
jgi:hypothetical protein